MNNKTVSGILLTLLLVGMLTLAFNIQSVKADGTIYIRADGSVDPATAPISSVDNVTYAFTDNIYDSIVVERRNIIIDGEGFTLQGLEDARGFFFHGIDNVTIKETSIVGFGCAIYAWSSSGNNFSENTIDGGGIFLWEYSNNNTVTNNSITNSIMSGIALVDSSSYTTIVGNTIGNSRGGISISDSSCNAILGNDITNNGAYGIVLDKSNNNTISGNAITNNEGGIRLYSSYHNLLRKNKIAGNLYNFGVSAHDTTIELSHFIHDIDSSNTVEGKPIYYWINRQNEEVPSDAGYIALTNSYNITVKNLELKNNGQGILFVNTSDSRITNNKVTNNRDGMYLYRSSNNILSGNTITNTFTQARTGVTLFRSCSDNIISGNMIANNNEYGLRLYHSTNNNTISANTITHNGYGVLLGYHAWGSCSDNIISRNIIANNDDGIELVGTSPHNTLCENTIRDNNNNGIELRASYNTISANNVTSNNHNGVYLNKGSFNTIAGNIITDNVYAGIEVRDASDNSISTNTIVDNYDGLVIFSDEYGVSSGNLFFENTIAHHYRYAIVFDHTSDNKIYHNNFLYPYVLISSSGNVWDDGYPSGGNYWSDNNSTDLFHSPYQNTTGSDGIGDSPYVLDSENNDTYPLMAPITFFDVGTWNEASYFVRSVSNSTVSDFNFSQPDMQVSFNVTGPDGTVGFCRVTIPNALLGGPYVILVNGSPPLVINEQSNGTHTFLYFTYSHSTKLVEITGVTVVPEFSTWISMLLLFLVLASALIIHKRRLRKTPIH